MQDSKNERTARANLYSAVEKKIGSQDIVICDALNYIKGFRYQLFCMAKNRSTPHVVVHAAASIETCRQWNAQRENGYDEAL